jgi:hypothetical protein
MPLAHLCLLHQALRCGQHCGAAWRQACRGAQGLLAEGACISVVQGLAGVQRHLGRASTGGDGGCAVGMCGTVSDWCGPMDILKECVEQGVTEISG